ncbi:hypothetical protein NL108_006502 [Boleophthalmus pectinirostris]|uniref:transmembrane protein 272-like n=1 Tax=Boleophthalmus pectinirostris TaxID=150288 RepID=UPI002432AAF6|nr:transmembrane protein 272-like [Boleophthalmus pectinirostris]KAJ0055635.1 hypothetical protein NL108_006502 [Boleophthalmus pectinirostris]
MSVLLQPVKNICKPSLPTLFCSKVWGCIWPVAQIVIGAVYLDECPREHYIPIYLVVMGVFSLMLALLACLPCAEEPKDGTTNTLHRLSIVWHSLVSTFLGCWFIAGNVWIYRIYEPNYVKNETMIDTYCHKTLYLFAFWSTTLVYIILGAVLLGISCMYICISLCVSSDPDDEAESPRPPAQDSGQI